MIRFPPKDVDGLGVDRGNKTRRMKNASGYPTKGLPNLRPTP